MKPIAILGCGPAGLMAAWAVHMYGRKPVIFSRPIKSTLGGAQFIHRRIPGINEPVPDASINYIVKGSARVYRQKVYAETEMVDFVSFENVKDGMNQDAWNLQATYDALWLHFEPNIDDITITPDVLIGLIESGKFEYIISTIPAKSICMSQAGIVRDVHHFNSQMIKIHPEAIYPLDNNTIYYDGTRDHSWYRCSRLFGIGGTEYPDSVPAIVSPMIEVRKPVWTDCGCFIHHPKFFRFGRYGSWRKGALTHDAYFGTEEVLTV